MKDIPNRCEDCGSELCLCGPQDEDGIPTDDCMVCQLREKMNGWRVRYETLSIQVGCLVPIHACLTYSNPIQYITAYVRMLQAELEKSKQRETDQAVIVSLIKGEIAKSHAQSNLLSEQLDQLRSELESETKWANQYHEEAEIAKGNTVTAQDENNRLRAVIVKLEAAEASLAQASFESHCEIMNERDKLQLKIKRMEETGVVYAKASVKAQTYRELLEDCVSAMRKAQCLIMDKPEAYEIQNKALQALGRANKQ